MNTAAIDLLTENQDKINWGWLSKNPAAINLLTANQDKIDWYMLSKNKSIFEIKFNQELYDLLITII
jgi:hypothetical protein